jgi:carboxypeptidase Q
MVCKKYNKKYNFQTRGIEWAQMIKPRLQPIAILGAGGSVGTNGVLTAPIIIVNSFNELEQRAVDVSGKILVYNKESSKLLPNGSAIASKYGAIALLVN